MKQWGWILIIGSSLGGIFPLTAIAKQVPENKPDCRPGIDLAQKQYIIGYGSLMQDESRQRTTPNADSAYPIEISGYRRGWYISGPPIGFGTTFLGVVPDPRQRFNAVIYEVKEPQKEIQATDQREFGYCRHRVSPEAITVLVPNIPKPQGQVWIYALKDEKQVTLPNAKYPIVQSYVDIFLSGCLEQAERFNLPNFPQTCVQTTQDWSNHWVNDRLYPRRPFIYQPKAGQIDTLLNQTLPDYFQQIKIE